MTKNDRANFGSKLGVILASAGSAVGLGNIWRFPYETGNHGGAAFILIYLACVLILGIPIMVSEFLIGRHSRANTAGAYQKLAPGTHWRWVGRMGVLAGFLILNSLVKLLPITLPEKQQPIILTHLIPSLLIPGAPLFGWYSFFFPPTSSS